MEAKPGLWDTVTLWKAKRTTEQKWREVKLCAFRFKMPFSVQFWLFKTGHIQGLQFSDDDCDLQIPQQGTEFVEQIVPSTEREDE